MKKILKIVLIIVLFFGIAAPVFAAPNFEDGDWQFWNDETFKASINDKIGVRAEQEFRWGDGFSKYFYEHTQLQLDYKALEWLTISPAFREVYELNSKEVWYPEHQPQLNVTGSWKIFGDWKVEARARIEYRFFGDPAKSDAWRNRDKFTLKSPWKLTPLNLNPYVSEEIFVQESVDGLSKNRLTAGLGAQFTKNVKGDLSYIWREQNKSGSWLESNVIQAQLKFEF